jgi:arabinose-5-phosphate isomerase
MHSGDRLPLVSPHSLLKEVVVEISKKGLGMVAVIDNQQKLLGIITDGDLRRILDCDHDIRNLTAAEFMTARPKTILDDAMAVDAVDIVNRYQIGGLMVVDSTNTVVGAFNVHDLFKAKLI